jgi:hypothetical protein
LNHLYLFATLVQIAKIIGTQRIIILPFHCHSSLIVSKTVSSRHEVDSMDGYGGIDLGLRSWLGKKEFRHSLACLAFWV